MRYVYTLYSRFWLIESHNCTLHSNHCNKIFPNKISGQIIRSHKGDVTKIRMYFEGSEKIFNPNIQFSPVSVYLTLRKYVCKTFNAAYCQWEYVELAYVYFIRPYFKVSKKRKQNVKIINRECGTLLSNLITYAQRKGLFALYCTVQ